MNFLKQLLAFYINSSIHVALSCFALVNITYLIVNIPSNNTVACFAFFGTIVSYNFVKFDALARANKNKMRSQLKRIVTFSFASLLMVIYYYFKLQNTTKIAAAFFLILTVLYTLPFFPNTKNARNWAGLKIYIVAICWVGVTVIMPILNSELAFQQPLFIIVLQRLALIFTLILIFEIIDLKTDDPHLKTVPQQIGVKNTKILGFVLLIVFSGIGFFNSNWNSNSNGNIQILGLFLNFVIAIVIALFLYFANENRSKYYASFWVESIPVFWWLLLLFIK
jgi:hypothetical protein